MIDLFAMLVNFFAPAQKFIPILAGGLNVLNGALTLMQKLLELWEKLKPTGGKKGKNKRSTKRTSTNP